MQKNNANAPLYLASSSPRRQELLAQIEPHFNLIKVDVVELKSEAESADDYVQRLAQEKAMAGVIKVPTDCLVLGADTIVVLGSQVLEKPRDKQHAQQMMQMLSGKTHRVLTAVCVASRAHRETQILTTEVTFCKIDEVQIEAYWQTGEPLDKAGGYGIQGLGGQFVAKINGSYSSVVGLPLVETRTLLTKFRSKYAS